MTTFGIVVAAGTGTRFGRPKANLDLRGVPLWQRAVACLREGGCETVVVVGDVPDGIPGGERRRDSVAAGLAAAPSNATHVLVHDAARPLATPSLAAAVIDRLRSGDVAAVVPVIPIRDTIKRTEGDQVIETVDRSHLVIAQTPQGFRIDTLRAAQAVDGDASDEAFLVELAGFAVATVPGEVQNLKITYPGDLALAEALLA